MNTQTVKLTVSIPEELVQVADRIAKEKKISRSKVVSSCLKQLAQERLKEELEEGYRAMSRINREVVKETFDAQREIVPDWS